MQRSGVGFGTSGVRGRVADMSDHVCYAYTDAFLQYLESVSGLTRGQKIAIAGDLRPSTPRILRAVAKAIKARGCLPLNCGFIPTPAVALYGMQQGIPSIMVTGSHIPDDRNGIKFNKPDGEILKQDEAAIRQQAVMLPDDHFNDAGMLLETEALPPVSSLAYQAYVNRYIEFFSSGLLVGKRIGLYEHSSVARQPLGEILEGLGAKVIRLGFSDSFIPVDTEAIRFEDIVLAREWSAEQQLDAIVSTDGDADRPLISDEHGHWLRGDVAGILCARYLGVKQVVTPVSCNTAVEKCGWFDCVERTRIGSPYVIEAMDGLLAKGNQCVVGYEANGGFLIADKLEKNGWMLEKLPTRDALIVILAVLGLSVEQGKPLSGLLNLLPPRFTYSGRLKNFPLESSKELLAGFASGELRNDLAAIETLFKKSFGQLKTIDKTDGVRITFDSEEVVHIRPSGNAPELRCYNEADSMERAEEMNRICLDILETLR